MNPQTGESYNIGGNYTCKIGDILNTLLDFSKYKGTIKVSVDPDRLRPIDADLQVPDVRKFAKHTGWKPKISFEKTMDDLLDYWRKRVKKDGNIFLQR